METIEFAIEIAIGIFAGYCCCYFICMKAVKMTPGEVAKEWLKIMGEGSKVMEEKTSCWDCEYHEIYLDEDEDGNLYDDGCICSNQLDYHLTNCPGYGDGELTGCPYFKRRERGCNSVS